MLLQIGLLILMFYVKSEKLCSERKPNSQVCIEKPSEDNGFVIKKWCFVETTDMVLVLLSGPIIMILLASFFAFREQNHPQAFYERKFLTFGCLNVSLLLIAVELGYKFISSYHGFTLLCFGTQITGIIFLGCFIVPRIYVGVMRSRHGEHVFHLEEHNNVDQQKKCSSRKLDHNLKETQHNHQQNPNQNTHHHQNPKTPKPQNPKSMMKY